MPRSLKTFELLEKNYLESKILHDDLLKMKPKELPLECEMQLHKMSDVISDVGNKINEIRESKSEYSDMFSNIAKTKEQKVVLNMIKKIIYKQYLTNFENFANLFQGLFFILGIILITLSIIIK
ncbi:MAG: hypothetical protein ACD_9C00104G0002 [uncultured bacterium]|nr:MAG: hypothetical protein ACD_9C00104G0002 [uncultured bacterium]